MTADKENCKENCLDNVSIIIILRALFIYMLVEKGWSVRKCKSKDTFEMYKSIKKNYN